MLVTDMRYVQGTYKIAQEARYFWRKLVVHLLP